MSNVLAKIRGMPKVWFANPNSDMKRSWLKKARVHWESWDMNQNEISSICSSASQHDLAAEYGRAFGVPFTNEDIRGMYLLATGWVDDPECVFTKKGFQDSLSKRIESEARDDAGMDESESIDWIMMSGPIDSMLRKHGLSHFAVGAHVRASEGPRLISGVSKILLRMEKLSHLGLAGMSGWGIELGMGNESDKAGMCSTWRKSIWTAKGSERGMLHSIPHEWFHALDYELGSHGAQYKDMLSENMFDGPLSDASNALLRDLMGPGGNKDDLFISLSNSPLTHSLFANDGFKTLLSDTTKRIGEASTPASLLSWVRVAITQINETRGKLSMPMMNDEEHKELLHIFFENIFQNRSRLIQDAMAIDLVEGTSYWTNPKEFTARAFEGGPGGALLEDLLEMGGSKTGWVKDSEKEFIKEAFQRYFMKVKEIFSKMEEPPKWMDLSSSELASMKKGLFERLRKKTEETLSSGLAEAIVLKDLLKRK